MFTDNTFIDALKIPAIVSTVRRIQADSGESLRVLHVYYNANRHLTPARQFPSLSAAEMAAVHDILDVVVRQSMDAVIFYTFAYSLFASGGVLAGQAAQIAISVNAMTAPKKQFIRPHAQLTWLFSDSLTTWGQLPQPLAVRMAFVFGWIAEVTGYHHPAQSVEAPTQQILLFTREERQWRATNRFGLQLRTSPESAKSNFKSYPAKAERRLA